MNKRIFAALLALTLFGAACSSEPSPAPSAGEQTEEDKKRGSGKKDQGNRKGSKAGGEGEDKKSPGKGQGDGNTGVPDADAAPDTGDSETGYDLGTLGPGGPEFATKSAKFEEPQPDAKTEGPLVPGYAEATALDVQGMGENLRITFTFNGQVPEKMPTQQTYMIASFALSSEKKGEKGYAINAQATNRGWQVAMGAKSEAKRFPGTFFVRGNTIEFTLPWSEVGGPRPFEFYASASWFHYAGTTSYSADPIPNEKAVFPN